MGAITKRWKSESSPHAKPHPGTYERDTDFRKDKRLGEGVSKKGWGIFGTSGNPGRPFEFAPATFSRAFEIVDWWNDDPVCFLERLL